MAAELETLAGLQVGAETSTNWCGYVITGEDDAFRSVSATWRVPRALAGPSDEYNTLASIWVGLNGSRISPVCLTQAGCNVNDYKEPDNPPAPEYGAWYAMEVNGRVGATDLGDDYAAPAGDRLSCAITYLGGLEFDIRLRNLTRGWTYDKVHHYPTGTSLPAMNSAEIIVEAPVMAGVQKIGKLTNFGTVEFEDVRVNGLPISRLNGQVTGVTMVDDTDEPPDGDNLLASPGTLGDSFAVTWHNHGRMRDYD
ncbi:G1 family glutamic endopeptidase [Actinophytocola oryzae]|uniref:Peptidase A4-like protein n=1 Tax=Actinophytocola oryzae TaxID=502181 RepID=A0A4R7V7G6_9PSEU|nr:G1 family glutamic endopeptidase [Actinophytocola oryzae]TDV44892.1 peptidase A4-like protein [Actinophytocola oryzae]